MTTIRLCLDKTLKYRKISLYDSYVLGKICSVPGFDICESLEKTEK